MEIEHAVITGASRGIGLCLARNLDARGVRISNLSRNAGPVGRHIFCDMRQNPAAAFLATANRPFELLVLNAGITEPGLLGEIDPQSFHDQMQINFFAAVEITRAAVPLMAAGGRIVFVASGAAFVGIQGHSAYCASKFALRGFAEAMRGELKPIGIEVSIVYPPNTDTDMFADELKLLCPETKAISMAAKTMSADAVAKIMLRGIDQGKFEIYPGMEMRVLGRFHSLFKPLIFRQMDRLARQAR